MCGAFIDSAVMLLFTGFRFHGCLREALQKAEFESSCQQSSCLTDTDPAQDTVVTALDRTNVAAASEQDCMSTPAACEQPVNCTDVHNICDMFQ